MPEKSYSIIRQAKAKINLGLEVLRKRKDGFHDINTIFTEIDLFDTIKIEHSAGIICECEPRLDIPPEKNLCYKTAELFFERFGIDDGVKISIEKRIPSGGGLGGGSSDSACVLKTLCEIYKIDLKSKEISELALELGSDVPFFLEGGTAEALGRGEILQSIDYKMPYDCLLIFPGIHVDTGQAYKSLAFTDEDIVPTDFESILKQSIDDPNVLKKGLKNDFERVVFAKHRELAFIKEVLYESGAIFALMSGSGSTVYGLFDSSEKVNTARYNLGTYNSVIARKSNI